ncbi:hypothetical protein L6164_009148 [Bauhinia variegata]|uniref:Uncharacterized protein n=1 Tax=Bauhinia variegata TaxID=167791 RepID=A0ACB9PIW6_BAUVA|nr:hypothetical protein L6164_009148 [Bauhinia variegata]
MGTLYRELAPLDLPGDLNVSIQESFMVFPSKETERKTMFLSNIDKVLDFDVETVHFFPSHKDFPPHVVADKLENALADALVHYDFFAGRLKVNSETGRLEVDCNAAGAVHKNKDFLKPGDHPLCVVQLTSFKCGGFAIGLSTSHTTFDGFSFKTFLDNLAALAAKKPLVVSPCHDRKLLAARSPPRVSFAHHELLKADSLPPGFDSGVFQASSEQLDFKIFQLTSDDLKALKEKAKPAEGHHSAARVTGFNIVTAHVWRCKALSGEDDDPNRPSTVLYAVDIRSR